MFWSTYWLLEKNTYNFSTKLAENTITYRLKATSLTFRKVSLRFWKSFCRHTFIFLRIWELIDQAINRENSSAHKKVDIIVSFEYFHRYGIVRYWSIWLYKLPSFSYNSPCLYSNCADTVNHKSSVDVHIWGKLVEVLYFYSILTKIRHRVILQSDHTIFII